MVMSFMSPSGEIIELLGVMNREYPGKITRYYIIILSVSAFLFTRISRICCFNYRTGFALRALTNVRVLTIIKTYYPDLSRLEIVQLSLDGTLEKVP